MEPKLKSYLFCDAIVPLPEGKIACYGIFTEVRFPSFPNSLPQFNILTSWSGGEGFHRLKMKILNPKKSLIISTSPETYFTLPGPEITAHVEIKVNKILFPEPGSYVFRLILNDEDREDILLSVLKRNNIIPP